MNLAILFGGASYEHEISIVSAITLKEKLSTLDLEFVFLDQDHTFYYIDKNKMDAKLFSSGAYNKEPVLTLEQVGFSQKTLFKSKSFRFERVLNLIHGADGEDATVAALFDFYGISSVQGIY